MPPVEDGAGVWPDDEDVELPPVEGVPWHTWRCARCDAEAQS